MRLRCCITPYTICNSVYRAFFHKHTAVGEISRMFVVGCVTLPFINALKAVTFTYQAFQGDSYSSEIVCTADQSHTRPTLPIAMPHTY
jgi:hypothetical protein